MTKTELLSTHTAEQLAEMVLYGEQIGEKLMDVITGGNKEIPVIFDKISRAETKGLEGENHKKTLIEKYQEEIDEWKKNHPYNTDERLEEQKLIKEIRRDENGIWLNMKDADFIQNYSKMQKTISDNQSEIAKLNCEVEKYRKAFEYAKKERDCQVAECKRRAGKDKTELERARTTIGQIDDILERLFGVRHDMVDKPDEFEKILSERAKGNVTDFLPTEPIKVADMLINASKKRTNCMTGKEYDKYIFDKWKLRQIAEHLLVYCNHNGEAEE